MKTAGEIAAELVASIKMDEVAQDCRPLIDRIAAAIKQARTEALEEAAKLCTDRADGLYAQADREQKNFRAAPFYVDRGDEATQCSGEIRDLAQQQEDKDGGGK